MDKSNKQELDLRWISVRLVERFMNVLYPVEIPLLLRLLPNIGYVVPKKVLKGVVEPGEALAIKGNVELVFNQDNKTLGVEGRDVTEVVEGFKELRSFWIEQLAPSPSAETHYVELGGQGIIESRNNPTSVFSEFWAGFERMQKLSKTIGFDVVNYGLRLVPQNVDPNNIEWFDLRIQPQVISSENHYYINIVWRSKDMDTALENFGKVNETIGVLIREIERK
jgi:hypothetical protein